MMDLGNNRTLSPSDVTLNVENKPDRGFPLGLHTIGRQEAIRDAILELSVGAS